MKPRKNIRVQSAQEIGDDPSRREFLEAVAALRPEDVAHRIEEEEVHKAPPRRKKGLPILETVDLHGLTAEQGIAKLRAALHRLRGRDGRVQVIVGKGKHSPDGVGVLREVIPAWMDTAGRALVAEWRWAGPKEGGRGALLVRLRQVRASAGL